jgi:adenylate kinase
MDSCARAGCAAAGSPAQGNADVSHPRIVFLGPPGSGKGTVAMALSGALGVPHVSTGQMFREAIRKGGRLGAAAKQFIDNGQLVPDEITVEVVRLWLEERGADAGFIFDGFPRTRPQAEALDRLLQRAGTPITVAVLLDLSENEILERVLGRLSCEGCGALYHEKFVPPKLAGVCDACGGRLLRRADDTAETVQRRLQLYRNLTVEVVEHYEKTGILTRVDGSRPKDKVFAEVLKLVKR